jgi:hypothetical protein
MSQTIYARVPDHVKEATDEYASTTGVTLANAVAELLERGLQATSDAESIARLELTATVLRNELDTLRQREENMRSAYQALAQRMMQPVGVCPECSASFSGKDLLISGRCPNPDCGASLTPLLAPSQTKSAFNDGELKVLFGALGVALGIAVLTQGGGG